MRDRVDQLGKIIAYGSDREAARLALVDGLDRTVISGLTTNTGFLRELAALPDFAQMSIDTAWLDRHGVAEPDDELARVFAAWANAASVADEAPHPFQADGWRLGAAPASMIIQLDRAVLVDRPRGRVDDHDVRPVKVTGDRTTLEIDGKLRHAVVQGRAHGSEVVFRGQRFVFERPDVFADHAAVAGDGAIIAPMPGTIVDVRVADGDVVAADQALIILEAMKMEVSLRAPFAGTVSGLSVAPGSQVALGATLSTVQPLPQQP